MVGYRHLNCEPNRPLTFNDAYCHILSQQFKECNEQKAKRYILLRALAGSSLLLNKPNIPWESWVPGSSGPSEPLAISCLICQGATWSQVPGPRSVIFSTLTDQPIAMPHGRLALELHNLRSSLSWGVCWA